MSAETSLSLSSLIYNTKELLEISVSQIVFSRTLMFPKTTIL